MNNVNFLKTIILLVFMTPSTQSFSQGWNAGSKWYYSYPYYPNTEFVAIKLVGDTVINGQQAKVMEGRCGCEPFESKFIFEDSNRVFRHNPGTDSFHLIYDFNKNAGDSLEIFLRTDLPLIKYYIDSIGYLYINDDTLKTQYLSYPHNQGYWFGEYLIEGFGSNACMFPQSGICDPNTGPLKCYYNPITGSYSFQDGVFCDESTVTGIPNGNLGEAAGIKIYPNPVKDWLWLDAQQNLRIDLIRIYDLNGREMVRKTNINESKIDVGGLKKGIYFVQIFSSETAIIKKIIK